MILKNFEQYLVERGLKIKYFISPIDRIFHKVGYRGPPIIYWNYIRLAAFMALYFFIFLPLLGFLFFSLVFFQSISWVSAFSNEPLQVFLPMLGVSIWFGLMTAYSFKRRIKKNTLPPWQSFAGDQ